MDSGWALAGGASAATYGVSSGGAHYTDGPPHTNGGRSIGRRSTVPEQALQFGGIEAMTAHHGAVEQKHRDVQSVATDELGVAVHVHDLDGGKPQLRRQRSGKRLEVGEHLVAELAILAM